MGRWRASLSFNLYRVAAKTKFINTSTSTSDGFPNFPRSLIPRTQFFNCRKLSAVSTAVPEYIDESVYRTYQNTHKKHPTEEEDAAKIPIKAYFLCTSINLKSLQEEQSRYFISPNSRSSKSIAFRFSNSPPSTNGIIIKPTASSYSYMVVFQYGSAVLFNVEDQEVEHYMQILRRHASGLLSEMRKDDYAVQENPLMHKDMHGGLDYIVLKDLDMDSIRIIGSVLGQSVALDHFESQVDGMVEEFTDINREMEKHGTFTMTRKKLFQLVGKANSNLGDVILKVGIFDRSEIAWRDAKYAQVYEYLREEYEVTQRFGNLHFKLKFVEHNIHFLQEVLQNRRSDLLEWVIIVLLIIENFLSIYELVRESGAGSI